MLSASQLWGPSPSPQPSKLAPRASSAARWQQGPGCPERPSSYPPQQITGTRWAGELERSRGREGRGAVTYARARGNPMESSTSSADPCLMVPGRCWRFLRGVTLLYSSSLAAMPSGLGWPCPVRAQRPAIAGRRRRTQARAVAVARGGTPMHRARQRWWLPRGWQGRRSASPGSRLTLPGEATEPGAGHQRLRDGRQCPGSLGTPSATPAAVLSPPPPSFSAPCSPGICNE